MSRSLTSVVRDKLRAAIGSGRTTQQATADATGLSQSSISMFLNGRDMRGEHLTALCRFLKIKRIDL